MKDKYPIYINIDEFNVKCNSYLIEYYLYLSVLNETFVAYSEMIQMNNATNIHT